MLHLLKAAYLQGPDLVPNFTSSTIQVTICTDIALLEARLAPEPLAKMTQV